LTEAEMKLSKIRGLLDVLEADLKEIRGIIRGEKQP